MQTVILAGGRGSRLSEETVLRPKPMVEIGGIPILQHVMSIYSAYDYKDFVVAVGYRGEMIKDYFRDLYYRRADLLIHLANGSLTTSNPQAPDWKIAVVDTGLSTMTAGRILRLRSWLKGPTFMVTYGDAVSDIDIGALLRFHHLHGRLATVTAVRPPSRFGALSCDGDRVREFSEKPQALAGWINGGFFVFQSEVFDYFADDSTTLEREPLERLAAEGNLMAYRHYGYWQPMDTLREKQLLESLWQTGNASWGSKVHDDVESRQLLPR